MICHQVPVSLTPMPVRDFFRKNLGISNTLWKKIKHSGTFRLNGFLVNPARSIVIGGDVICYELPVKETDLMPEPLPLDILYEDDDLLIVNKPAGQLVHPTVKETHGTLANAVLYYFQEIQLNAAYHPVHRLDRNTSGLVLIAKAPQIHYQLSPKGQKLFNRQYLALAEGCPCPTDGCIDAPIGRKEGSIIARAVTPLGRDARTHYTVLRTDGRFSLLRLRLETGRTHQIRVHLSHIGHPLLGDDLYGGSRALLQRQALHAEKISFFHPVTKEYIEVSAPLPEDMEHLLSYLPI